MIEPGRPEAPRNVAGASDDGVARDLATVARSLPGGGEERPGQLAMAQAVERALAEDRHLVVQAGTGTGKSLAYLLPVVRSGRKAVVATATKALQDQLAAKDLPQLAATLEGTPLRYAVLKGRANYLCRQRVAEIRGLSTTATPGARASLFDTGDAALAAAAGDGPTGGAEAQLLSLDAPASVHVLPDAEEDRGLSGDGATRLVDQVRRLAAWADDTVTGDRSELEFEPSPRAWAMVSVTARECPGAFRCPAGPDCFAEHARARAAAADVVVVNTHLYATHVASDGAVLPDHDVLVLDEAHAVEDVMTSGLGMDLTPGRVRAAANGARPLLAADDVRLVDALHDAALRLEGALRPLAGRRVLERGDATDAELLAVLELAGSRVAALAGALRRGGDDDLHTATRRARALLAVSHLGEDLAGVAVADQDRVAWVERGAGAQLVLRTAPVEVGPLLAERVWPRVTAVLTSATVPPRLGGRLGLPASQTDELDVGSPFPYEEHALLYCPVDLPDRRDARFEPALHRELRGLIEAAGGRTLALFTSWRAMHNAVDALRETLPFPVYAQNDLPKPALVEAFAGDESACLFATMSFWQGVDVPGRTLSLVTLDRLPFPRPDDPLLQARRDRAGEQAFRQVDLPRAATLLAQGAGRLIRSSRDRGVVAVLDRRLATAGYRRELMEVLPPMRTTRHRAEVVAFLRAIAAEG